MNVSEYIARRAAAVAPTYRDTCTRCRKAVPTCYCHVLRPFRAPVPFVILQHPDEARNTIATARMAHLSMTNSQLFVERGFAGHAAVNRLIADPERRNVMLFPSRDALPMERLFAESAAPDACPPTFWVLDAKWSQVPKMLRLSPNLRAMPMVRFSPERTSRFQIRRQPHPSCLSTIESIYLVIERYLCYREGDRPSRGAPHEALIDVFQHMVQQQLGYVNVELDTRHLAARAGRAARRSGSAAR